MYLSVNYLSVCLQLNVISPITLSVICLSGTYYLSVLCYLCVYLQLYVFCLFTLSVVRLCTTIILSVCALCYLCVCSQLSVCCLVEVVYCIIMKVLAKGTYLIRLRLFIQYLISIMMGDGGGG